MQFCHSDKERRLHMSDSIVVLSGGMDSACALWWAHKLWGVAHTISINYGQRHKKELAFASTLSELCGVSHTTVDLSDIRGLLPGSALTDNSVEVPKGHYASPTMKDTVVPNRNMLLLSVAVAAAGAHGASRVVYGAHAGDHPIYPDCRPEFVDAMATAFDLCWYTPIKLEAPFVNKTKAEIVTLGQSLGVPWEHTWSCYEGGDLHCGVCGTCVERREAFYLAEVQDPTEYCDKTPVEQLLGACSED